MADAATDPRPERLPAGTRIIALRRLVHPDPGPAQEYIVALAFEPPGVYHAVIFYGPLGGELRMASSCRSPWPGTPVMAANLLVGGRLRRGYGHAEGSATHPFADGEAVAEAGQEPPPIPRRR
jgi:hypothetical protein